MVVGAFGGVVPSMDGTTMPRRRTFGYSGWLWLIPATGMVEEGQPFGRWFGIVGGVFRAELRGEVMGSESHEGLAGQLWTPMY